MRRIGIVITTSLLLVSLLALLQWQAIDIKPAQQDLVRLHVVANSNSLADQLVKRQVKREIRSASKELFIEVTDVSQAQQLLKLNRSYLTKIAQQKLEELRADYEVEIKLGEFSFPRRSYGSLTLPAGEYLALNVVLGSGQGENWWCVLFPPLCVVEGKSKEINQLSKEVNGEEGEIPVEFKSKLFEYTEENPELVKLRARVGKIIWNLPH